ncbi:alcohol dehydrogenase [Afipia sp. P52-10]|uniref:NADPH:quinone reductase n=1 Tax=Afipia sp. P52-10 TaxID=1429916 RepID=UPI0003DF2217|nr:NADPH:quinone reductase [Afipia sp. P52-10]ETR77058.1 alcohol dehydrogenase [Afipia sp. P52-10]
MKAVWYDRQGPAREVFVYGEVPTPNAGQGEVRIKLEASGVNPSDTYRRMGTAGPMEYPRVIANSDGAGIVDQVGPGAKRFKVGDRIWLYNGQRNGRAFGTAAEYIALDENLVTPLPDNVSFAEGATLGVPGMTAWVCLYHAGPVKDQTVLVTGGAGAVGHYGIQLAKWGGARVITTVSSPQKAEIAKAAGADLIINYKTENVAERVLAFAPEGVDRIVEVDFGGNIETTEKILGRFSTVAIYATKGNLKPQVTIRTLTQKNVTVYGMQLPLTPMPLQRKAQAGMAEWLASGRHIHMVAQQFPLKETVDAHLAVEAGTKLGTVIVDCAR